MGLFDKVGAVRSPRSKPKSENAPPVADQQASTKDMLGPRILSEGTNPVVDLIFLHGLTGDRDGTWTAAGCKDPWPQSLLAEDFPQARIMSYGYDADIFNLTKEAGLSTVREHSSSFIFDLNSQRVGKYDAVNRPIIFIAHCFGGLICQDSLLFCNNPTNQKYKTILDCTRGVVFLGTPHAGVDLESIVTAAATQAGLTYVKKPNPHVFEVLYRNSALLANIENEFSSLIRGRLTEPAIPIELFVFLEEKPVQNLGKRIVEPESAKIKGYGFANIPADHVKMTKFAKRDIGYQRVFGLLNDWIESIKSNTGSVSEAV